MTGPRAPSSSLASSRIHQQSLDAELDALAIQRIPTVLRWLAGIYGAYSAAHWVLLDEPFRSRLTALAFATAVAYGLSAIVWRRVQPARPWGHRIGSLMALGVLLNCAVHMAYYPEPRHTINFYLFLLGAGLLILSTPWFAALVTLSWITWGYLALNSPPSPDWLHFGIGYATFTLVIGLVHRVHRQQLGNLRILHRRDLENRRLLEQTLDETRAASEAKSRFLAHMSHEFRTPLGSIIGFSDLLARQRKGPLNPAQSQFVDRIGNNGRHLLTLIDQVLDLARLESGRVELRADSVDLSAMVRELAASLEPQATNRRLDLRLSVPDHAIDVIADPDRLRQVILNLAGNALKFTKAGHVEIAVGEGYDGDDGDEASVATLTVSDTGIGIAQENLERIFQPFEQVDEGRDRHFGGAGLGLAISRDLCRQMGCELTAISTVGVGSTFTIRFVGEHIRGARP